MDKRQQIEFLEAAIKYLEPLDAERVIDADVWKLKRELDRMKAAANLGQASFEISKRVTITPLDTKLSRFKIEEYLGNTLSSTHYTSAKEAIGVESFDNLEQAAEEILAWHVGDSTYEDYKEVVRNV
jgi:hypothetical protein